MAVPFRASIQFGYNAGVFEYENNQVFTSDDIATIAESSLRSDRKKHLADLMRETRASSLKSLKCPAPNADLEMRQAVDLAIFGCGLLLIPGRWGLRPQDTAFIEEEASHLRWLRRNLELLEEPEYTGFREHL